MTQPARPSLLERFKTVVRGVRLRRHLAHAARGYTKFIILCRARTGSSLLVEMLAGHPHVRCESEIFNRLDGQSIEDVLARVYRRYPPEVQAVGFKIFYYHPLDDPSRLVWRRLLEVDDLRVIHLRRRNLLRIQVSHEIARLTDVWHNRSEAGDVPLEERRVTLDAENLLRHFEKYRQQEDEFDALFAARKIVHVDYEELVADPAAEFARVTAALGVEARAPATQLKRQNPEPLSELVTNFEKLKEHFAGTEWEELFDTADGA